VLAVSPMALEYSFGIRYFLLAIIYVPKSLVGIAAGDEISVSQGWRMILEGSSFSARHRRERSRVRLVGRSADG